MAKTKSDSKPSNLQELKDRLNAKYGKGTIIGGSESQQVETVVSTGSIKFDESTNCGGIPLGKLIEIMGPESSGKSTSVLHIIAEFQAAGYTAMLCDSEHSFDASYAATIGVDVDNLIYTQPETMEDAYNLITDAIDSGLIQLIVIDSHTSLVCRARLEGEIGDAKIAPEARVHSQALLRIKPSLDQKQCTIIGVSQLREDIGSMHGGAKSTGGNAWKFYPDMRIKLFKIADKVNEVNKTNIEIIKNKCGKPFGKCEIPIEWGTGIDKVAELIDVATEYKLITRGGSWYSQGELKLGQGINGVKAFMSDNPEFYEALKQQVYDIKAEANDL